MKKGENIIEQGDDGDFFYVVESGFHGLITPLVFIRILTFRKVQFYCKWCRSR